jgi:riboflavin synthase
MGVRLDGHMVQGHVDDTAKCVSIKDENGSWVFEFEYNQKFEALLIDKGSICINGTSLTVFNINANRFSVAIIPYTYENTNFQALRIGDLVNIEYDMIGKYLNRFKTLNK